MDNGLGATYKTTCSLTKGPLPQPHPGFRIKLSYIESRPLDPVDVYRAATTYIGWQARTTEHQM